MPAEFDPSAGVALVLGGADCVLEDVEAALDLGEFHGTVGCNHIGIFWPGVMDAWVSLHTENFKPWWAGRARRGLPPHKVTVGMLDVPSAKFPGQTEVGTSGLFAVKVALDDLGFGRAVICGIPMDPRPHFDDPSRWLDALSYRAAWRQALPHIRHRVRSMSGWTADLLGRPTEDWLR